MLANKEEKKTNFSILKKGGGEGLVRSTGWAIDESDAGEAEGNGAFFFQGGELSSISGELSASPSPRKLYPPLTLRKDFNDRIPSRRRYGERLSRSSFLKRER